MTDTSTSVVRVSHERLVSAKLRAVADDFPNVGVFSGQGAANRFGVDGWDLRGHLGFQYGDLRFGSDLCTLVVEAESAGGVSNLVKYRPYLANHACPRRFILVYLFQIGSDGDYIAHRRLWAFLVDRIRSDLKLRKGLQWQKDWETHLFSYRPSEELSEVVTLIRSCFST